MAENRRGDPGKKNPRKKPGPPWKPAEDVVLKKLHADGHGRNEIAKMMGRPPGTIKRHADELGLSWDRSATAVAVQARVARMAEKRQRLAEALLDASLRAVEDLDLPATVVELSRECEWVEHTTARPNAADQQRLMTVAGIGSQRHRDLVDMDSDRGASAAVSLIEGLVSGLRGRRDGDDTSTSG